MRGRDGSTLFELLTVLAVAGVLAAVAVPGAARVRSTFAGAEGARRLALVLRAAQAEAQSRSGPCARRGGRRRRLHGDRRLRRPRHERPAGRTRVTSTYPGGVLEFTRAGMGADPGSSSPRAGHFGIAGATRRRR